MATPTYTINSIDASGNINITIFAGSSYKNYYFEVYIRYDEPSSTKLDNVPNAPSTVSID